MIMRSLKSKTIANLAHHGDRGLGGHFRRRIKDDIAALYIGPSIPAAALGENRGHFLHRQLVVASDIDTAE